MQFDATVKLVQIATLVCLALVPAAGAAAEAQASGRRPADDEQLRFWLENMLFFHRYSPGEAAAAT